MNPLKRCNNAQPQIKISFLLWEIDLEINNAEQFLKLKLTPTCLMNITKQEQAIHYNDGNGDEHVRGYDDVHACLNYTLSPDSQ